MELFIVIFLLIGIALVFINRYKRKQQKKLQVQGLTNITHIKQLMSLVQIHRGLNSAFLNGDQSKASVISSTTNKIKSEIKYLELQDSIYQNHRWKTFNEEWVFLKEANNTRNADISFTLHTHLIVSLLYLLEDEAEGSYLNAMCLPQFPTIGFVWRELISTTEAIGQSRAIGMGVATSKKCSSVHKIRLSFLQQNMQKTMEETLPKLSSLAHFSQEHNELLSIAKSKVALLSLTIERELISADLVTIDQDEYFAQATNSIAALDNIFAHQVQQIEQQV